MSETREAAKRLCHWADESGLKALPHPGQVVELKKGKQSQHVRLSRTEGGWFWFWLWEPFRTEQDVWEAEKGLPMGQERDMVRRVLAVLEIAEAGEKVT
ncbi:MULTISPECIES: hypothetical protein [Nocardiopsis]|uniref:Uncharacterized protein n=1 Tax=Nocardiopsis lambiniae TaxID=3075539 RepID=A0ABU2MD90_9ACTN|nr:MULTISPECIES: hypothetical protein [unclassified Nocardiopsis]MDE3720371.1 hypothetical protein [Nocardiopsis sp. N85]MDT0330535.1 hypothetical protein [Nocardiopsis sp. DSM 44743]